MEIRFKIIGYNPDQHSIVVRYYTDIFTEDSLATSYNQDGSIARKDDGSPLSCQTDYNINVWKTSATPTEEDIKKIANDSAPYDWFQLKYDILNPEIDTSLSVVDNLINKEFVAVRPTFKLDIENPEQQNIEEEIQKIIDSLTANTN